MKMWLWTPNEKQTMALNAKMKMNDSERRNEKCDDIELKAYNGSECRTERMALNAKLKVITMNAEQKHRPNAKLKQQPWMPN